MFRVDLKLKRIAGLKEQQGVVLLESLVAILIIAFGVLGIIGLQATSVASVSDARYRIEATELADELLNQIWVDTSAVTNNLPSYVNSGTPPSAWLAKVNQLPGASSHPPVLSSAANNVVSLTINWKPAGGDLHSHRVVTAINRNLD